MIVPRSFFDESAVPNPPRRVSTDWLLVGAFCSLAIIEGVLNTDLFWRWFHVVMVLALTPTLLWRRTHPLLMVMISFVATSVASFAAFVAQGMVADGPYTAAFLLINVYAVFRWASGRHAAITLGAMTIVFILHSVIDYGGIAETIGGLIVFLFPAELGVIARLNVRNQEQARQEVRSAERERIARELHDSVAHHVSAIAIQAQAGRAMAASNPAAAVEVLSTIEEEAARTLVDMRTMVGSLREGDEAGLTPQPGLREIASLAGTVGAVDIVVEALADSSAPSAVGAALYRIAQESVTNAVRHASNASRVKVSVTRSDDAFQLTVSDDGRSNGADASGAGYGLLGMAERARLLGGTLDAGPSPSGGWLVEAELPVAGSIS